MFGQDRNQLRQFFYDCWQRRQDGATLDAMQAIIVHIIEEHPEYHQMLSQPETLDTDYSPESGQENPFLHMSMHIALHEQISTNRPEGIAQCYQQLCEQNGSAHEAEHKMMACLGEAIWAAQRNGCAPDENNYMFCLKKLLK